VTRALLVRTAGTNCDRETARALELAGAAVETRHVARLIESPALLEDYSLVCFPGGFSYGDDVAAGRLLGFELRQFLSAPLRSFVAAGGHLLGICNGFQVLLDAGLFERAGARRTLALGPNASAHFECRWIVLQPQACRAAWIEGLPPLELPVAHGEGRFLTYDSAGLAALEQRGQVALRYLVPDGASEYPHAPNGSIARIAGICDETGRVLGLMPHPERNLTPWHHPRWTRSSAAAEGAGLPFYRRFVAAARASRPT
jgi:phosphoribosylformylglycinamidine synthase